MELFHPKKLYRPALPGSLKKKKIGENFYEHDFSASFFFLCLEMFKYTADLGKVYWLKLGDEKYIINRILHHTLEKRICVILYELIWTYT